MIATIPAVDIKIANIDWLKTLPVNLGANRIEIRISSQGEFRNEARMKILVKDGYTTQYSELIPEIQINPGLLDTIITYTTKENIPYLNCCDFGIVKVKVVSREHRAEFVQSTEDFGGNFKLAICEYRYFKNHCEYFDGGIYSYQVNKNERKIQRIPVTDQFGLLSNSGIKVSNLVVTKIFSSDQWIDFISICREINTHQVSTEARGLEKGTGMIKFDHGGGRVLYVSHKSPYKIKIDSLLNKIYEQQ